MALKGLFGTLQRAASGIAETVASQVGGRASLRDAYLEQRAPNRPGVYKVFYRRQLKKVGKAPDGLRKRFSDYYRGEAGGTAGLRYITRENRDQVLVEWVVCPAESARRIELEWYDQAQARGESMPWSDRR